MKRNLWILLLLFMSTLFVSCSDKDEPEEIVFIPDFNKIAEYQGFRRQTEVNYRFDANRNYETFNTLRHFFEVYSEGDSLAIEDLNYTSFSPSIWSFKFSPTMIKIYRTDREFGFTHSEFLVHINGDKLIQRVETFYNSTPNTTNILTAGQDYIYSHNARGNLIDILVYQNDSNVLNDPPIWRNSIRMESFDFFDQPLPSLQSFYTFVPTELEMVLYNLGYRYSTSGVQNFDYVAIDPNMNEDRERVGVIMSPGELQFQVNITHSFDGTINDTNDGSLYYLNFPE